MAVRLLAGPFNTTLNGQTGQEVPPLVVEASPLVWWPGVGMVATGAGYSTGVMTLDGRYCDRQNHGAGNLFYDDIGYWPAKNVLVWVGWGNFNASFEQMVEPITFASEKTGPVFPSNPNPDSALQLRAYIKLADRSIYFQGAYGDAHPERGAFMVVVENVLIGREGPRAPFAGGRVQPGRTETEVFVSDGSGQGIFYDTVTKQWSSRIFRTGMAGYRFVFSTDWNVFISGHNWVSNPELNTNPRGSNQIRIWSMEVHPTILTPPEVVEGEVKSGQVVKYQVQVTGDDEDGAEDELVNWYLTGAGTLLTVQSKTDKEGFATARVQYGVQETGESKLEATVLC